MSRRWPASTPALLTAVAACWLYHNPHPLATWPAYPTSPDGLAPASTNSSFLQEEDFARRLREKAVAKRAEAAVLGAFLADAACAGSGARTPAAAFPGNTTAPEFHTAPDSEVPPGSFSPYGYELLPLLHTLMANRTFSPAQFRRDSHAFFLQTAGPVRPLLQAFAACAQRWPEGAADGADCGQAGAGPHSLFKVPLLLARHAALEPLAPPLLGAVRVHQRSVGAEAAALAFAALLERIVVLGEPLEVAAEAVGAARAVPRSARRLVRSAQRACRRGRGGPGPGPGLLGATASHAFRAGLCVALQQLNSSSGYAAAVRSNILLGGDATARAHVVGALLGAAGGRRALPKEWQQRATKFLDVRQMVHIVVVQRQQFVPVVVNRDLADPVNARARRPEEL